VEERLVTRRVLERVGAIYGDRVEIEPVFWEHEPLRPSGEQEWSVKYLDTAPISLGPGWLPRLEDFHVILQTDA